MNEALIADDVTLLVVVAETEMYSRPPFIDVRIQGDGIRHGEVRAKSQLSDVIRAVSMEAFFDELAHLGIVALSLDRPSVFNPDGDRVFVQAGIASCDG